MMGTVGDLPQLRVVHGRGHLAEAGPALTVQSMNRVDQILRNLLLPLPVVHHRDGHMLGVADGRIRPACLHDTDTIPGTEYVVTVQGGPRPQAGDTLTTQGRRVTVLASLGNDPNGTVTAYCV